MKYFWIVLAVLLLAALIWLAVKILKMKNQGICPLCVLKQYTKPTKITMDLPEENYCNGVAQTPPMGWSSWNTFRQQIDESIIRQTAEAMKASGLLEAGYQYLNLDDCWHSSLRDSKGRLQGDLTNFPSGIPQLVKDVNAQGIKLGLYTSNGTLTCEDLPASLGKEQLDALTFALWGIEFFKYDFCHNVPISTYAPSIEGISVGKAGSSDVTNLYAKDAQLLGRAKILKDEKLPTGEYIGFLGNGAGKAGFKIKMEEGGEYVLTLLLKKSLRQDKYLQIQVNGRIYEVTVPGTKSWSVTGRHQLMIELQAGENEILLYNPVATKADSAYIQYKRMGDALHTATTELAKKTGLPERPIVYSICEWGRNFSWHWGAKAGNLWRTTPDIFATWFSIMSIYEHTIKLGKYAGPGGWNDPDMLEVGNGKLTKEENKAHFTLWCMMSAPLVLGNDIRKFMNADGTVNTDDSTLKIVTNRDLIAIDQDRMGFPAKRIKRGLRADILAKPLANGDIAVCFINKCKMQKSFYFDIHSLAQDDIFRVNTNDRYNIRELWMGEEQEGTTIKTALGGHACRVYRISKI